MAEAEETFKVHLEKYKQKIKNLEAKIAKSGQKTGELFETHQKEIETIKKQNKSQICKHDKLLKELELKRQQSYSDKEQIECKLKQREVECSTLALKYKELEGMLSIYEQKSSLHKSTQFNGIEETISPKDASRKGSMGSQNNNKVMMKTVLNWKL